MIVARTPLRDRAHVVEYRASRIDAADTEKNAHIFFSIEHKAPHSHLFSALFSTEREQSLVIISFIQWGEWYSNAETFANFHLRKSTRSEVLWKREETRERKNGKQETFFPREKARNRKRNVFPSFLYHLCVPTLSLKNFTLREAWIFWRYWFLKSTL